MIDYVYYKVTGEEALSKIEEWQKEARETNVILTAFIQKYGNGSNEYIRSGSRLDGIKCDVKPDGWIEVSYKYYRPHARKKVCKVAYDEYRSLPKTPNSVDLANKLGLPQRTVCPGGVWASISMDILNGINVLGIPVDCDGQHQIPDGCIELKMSEYWKLKKEVKVA